MTGIAAHRGGAMLRPENSRSACEGAITPGENRIGRTSR
jgi:glycerophosphoryl diester phosphodiesterase